LGHAFKKFIQTDPVWGWYQRKKGRYKERLKEAECNGNIIYSCMKIEK
jgi:hypothetical protein